MVVLGVLLRAHPKEADVQKPNGAREHPVPAEVLPAGELLGDGAAQVRERPRKGHHPVELGVVPADSPAGVVDVLAPPAGIQAHCLDMAVGDRADPDFGPRRRDDEGPDALERVRVGDPTAPRVEIDPAAAGPAAGDARVAPADSAELPGHAPPV